MDVTGAVVLPFLPRRFADSSHFNSCFNAFSRVDVRVDVKIPGGVLAYVIDLRGERCVSAILVRRVLVLIRVQTRHDS